MIGLLQSNTDTRVGICLGGDLGKKWTFVYFAVLGNRISETVDRKLVGGKGGGKRRTPQPARGH